MSKRVDRAAGTVAECLPNLMSGADLDFFTKFNITNSQFISIITIFNAKKCTMGFLAERLRVSMPTVTGLMDRLVRLKLVRRSSSHEDRRVVYVELTEKGLSMVSEFKAFIRRRWVTLLSGLNPKDLKTFERIFKAISLNKTINENGPGA